ncbi:MAG: hypothetical protein ABEJ61_11660 [Haloferacaceae archaeon]
MDRDAALDRVADIVDAVEHDPMPVPVREVWVYGDVALGLDPVERLDVYVTKDLLLDGEADEARERSFRESHGVRGVGKAVDADWAERYPDRLRANDAGYAAPEKCLAAHLLPDDEPVHLEVCNASFDDNVTRRLEGALARDAYGEILDPRGVCLWADGTRADEAFAKLRGGELPFPTLAGALEMLGVDESTAAEAAEAVRARRADVEGPSVRGDVV